MQRVRKGGDESISDAIFVRSFWGELKKMNQGTKDVGHTLTGGKWREKENIICYAFRGLKCAELKLTWSFSLK